MKSFPPRSMPRLLLGAATAAWLGSAAAFAQSPPIPRMPAMPSLPSLPALPGPPAASSVGGTTLGALQLNLGGPNPTTALGSITVCPVAGAGSAAPAASPLPSNLSIVSTPTAPPILTPQTLTSSAVAAPLAVAPAEIPAITSPLGTTTLGGACSPTILGDTATSQFIPPESLIQSVYGDAATPAQATETSGGGLSPLIEVPPPVLFSPSGPTPNASGAVLPTQ
jgi:hypothetical protein